MKNAIKFEISVVMGHLIFKMPSWHNLYHGISILLKKYIIALTGKTEKISSINSIQSLQNIVVIDFDIFSN